MVKNLKNPVFVSSLLLAILFYSGVAKIRDRNPFACLAKKSEIIRLEGFVSSNPVKSSFFGSTYKTSFRVKRAFTSSGVFEARGEVNLYFPAALVEAYYPGKVYSRLSSREKGFIVENGGSFLLDVKCLQKGSERSFLVEDGKFLGWQGGLFQKKVAKIRALCRLQFKRLMYAWGKAGGLLLALLSGSREYTEKTVADSFRDSGLSHILALSGMHLGLFGGIARFFGKKARGRNFADAVQLGAVAFFVWFAGISPSLFRAFLAALILYLNSLFRMNRPEGLSLLSFCFILHCLIFPSHIMEAAFMLSYASLAGIIIFSRVFTKVYPVFIPHKIRLSLSDSSAAQLSTAPVAIRLFGKIMPQGIVASLFVAPLVFLFLYFGLFGLIICLFVPFLSGPISVIMNGLYSLISKLVLFFSFK
ncbi:ComEC/Rec2 family competence protein [Treponema ruminis]|uniref:Competence protein ComEC n=1 Tax=Treponema ruminis TaxID=744515 RepID=A0A7W8G7N6_9SPIR|nr:ComEC/Rec2 family competence protein [Treponema ruminis]MBB5225239.1 competence protein ComEC [Treponema ruminis]QSI01890.1 ComEC/Rec2 family competence protein [Treponema ruminis]